MAERGSGPRNLSNGATASSSTGAKRSTSPLRQRPLARAATLADLASPASALRRASFMTANSSTHSLDRASLFSSTDDLLLPRASRKPTNTTNHESSHLDSAPLALALLPALGGMLFSGGSQVLTDVTLLVLASVFLNWSVRLPWDWYHAAQAVRFEDGNGEEETADSWKSTSTIIEEEPLPLHTSDSTDRPDESSDNEQPTSLSPPPPRPNPASTSAATELRIHELLALALCFLSPVLGAALLHAIRNQLSRPSEGLVSDYNLSIFLLAAELRPLSHLIKMVQARTLHLQAVASRNNHPSTSPNSSTSASELQDLRTRIEELETSLSERLLPNNGSGTTNTTTTTTNDPPLTPAMDEKAITAVARRAVQPDLDALTRATRRYEKKATLLGLQTGARLNELDARLQDALALAAGAERAASRRGLLATLVDGLLWMVGLPGRLLAWACARAWGVLREVWDAVVVRGLLAAFGGAKRGKKAGRGAKAEGKAGRWEERDRERDGVREKRKKEF